MQDKDKDLKDKRWRPVCSATPWTTLDAAATCRHLGFRGLIASFNPLVFETLEELRCEAADLEE